MTESGEPLKEIAELTIKQGKVVIQEALKSFEKASNLHKSATGVMTKGTCRENRLQSLDKNSVQTVLKIRICLATKPKANDVKLRRMLKNLTVWKLKKAIGSLFYTIQNGILGK